MCKGIDLQPLEATMVKLVSMLLSSARRYSNNYIDALRIYVKGGSSGAGLLRYGGIGGRGGDVYLVGTKEKDMSLRELKQKFPAKRFSAEAGESSTRRAISGLPGKNIYVQIPHGITVREADTGKVLGKVNKPGDRVLAARGGKGGDRFSGFKSRKGEAKSVILDLQIIADVGFVGFPNAGKSTLLNAISSAKPEVADYPFTTLRPHIGTINYPDFRKITCADLPGLIEGAHANLGMGHKFLKHIERTKLLLFVVDLFGFSLYTNRNLRDAFENVQLLTKELELYNNALLKRPAILVFNKIDREGADQKLNTVLEKLATYEKHLDSIPSDMVPTKQIKFSKIVSISAKEGISLAYFKNTLRDVIDKTVKPEDLRLSAGSPLIAESRSGMDETDLSLEMSRDIMV